MLFRQSNTCDDLQMDIEGTITLILVVSSAGVETLCLRDLQSNKYFFSGSILSKNASLSITHQINGIPFRSTVFTNPKGQKLQ